MSQVSDNFLGLTLDDGAAFLVKESAQSDTGVATITNVTLETFKFIGSQARNEYLMPQMTQLDWSLKAFENRVPDCELLFDQAMTNPSPVAAIGFFDELVKMAAGSSAAPSLRVIPGCALLQNAYKSAESISDSLHGAYHYDGYVREGGAIPVLPRALTPAQLQGVAITLDAHWQTLLTALDLEVFTQLNTLIRTWSQAELTTVGDDLRAQDAMALLRSLAIYEPQPAWANHEVHVDPETGIIMVDGQVPLPAQMQAAFPTGRLGQTPYHGGVRQLYAWANDHNTAMQNVPRYAQVQWLPHVPATQNHNDASFHVRDLHGNDFEMTRDELVHLVEGINGNPPTAFLFSLTFGRPNAQVTEYCVSQMDGNGANNNVNHHRSAAWRMWQRHHSGLPNLHGSGVRAAQVILGLRDDALRNAALVPAIAHRLAEYRDALMHVPNQDLQATLALLAGVENATDSATLGAHIDAVRANIAQFAAHMPQAHDLGNGSVVNTALRQGFTVIGTGRYAPTEERVVALVPVLGRGVAPVVFERADDSNRITASRALDVAVVLEEPPATVYSPVKTMMGTALLQRLLDYLDGVNCPPGYNFDVYDPVNPYGTGQQRPSPHSLLNRQLDRYEQAIVREIDNATVDKMPDILRAVQRIVDARYFLAHIDEVIDSIMDREDWIYMLQSLIIGLMVRQGAQIVDSLGRDVVSVDSGAIPVNAARFLFGTVMREIRARPEYGRIVTRALGLGLTAPPVVTQAANLTRVIRAEVLFHRAVQGLELLKSLIDGSNDLVSNVHVGTIQHLIDVDLANELLTALRTVFERDYLGLIDKVEFEAPWECVDWTTQFAAFSFSVRHTDILYQAVDVATEIATDSGMASVATALARVGFDWTEIAPAALRVRGADQSTANIGLPMPMACGGGIQGIQGTPAQGFYNDAPVAHQGLKVTTVMPSYDIEAYNLVKAYLTMNTSRTYFAQPVGLDIADLYRMRLPTAPNSKYGELLDLVLNDTTGLLRVHLATAGVQFEKTPALANVAIILPYVANYLQKTALTRDYPVPQCLQVDTAQSLASTSGVTICPAESMRADILSPTNGLAITVAERRSISTALPWVGS